MFRKFAAECAKTALAASKTTRSTYLNHFKPAIKDSAIFTKNLAVGYTRIGLYGAAFGGGAGGLAASVFTLPTFLDGACYRGGAINGFKEVGNLWLGLVGVGMIVGGAPITYPLSKAYDYVSQKMEEKETQKPSLTRENLENVARYEEKETQKPPLTKEDLENHAKYVEEIEHPRVSAREIELGRQREYDENARKCKLEFYGGWSSSPVHDMGFETTALPGIFTKCFQLQQSNFFKSAPEQTQKQLFKECTDRVFEDYQRCLNKFTK